MVDDTQGQWLVPTEGAKTLPAIEILTGRGFITGKSGSGKSNTGSVIAEGLLENNYNLLIVDPEGEYYGLKERYEILHVGNDDLCDVQVSPSHAPQLAEIALERNMPIILDVSDYLDGDEASDLIANVVRELFKKEKDARKPFLLVIEEMQEYLPQQGGTDELSELLERVAKRGRKRGLGMLGMSQRPSSVDKDFITQCDWMVWHRLTWQNDVDVVRKVLGSDVADQVEDLDTGEGFLMTDWDESVEKVRFKRKDTHDAGATPGLESYERPDLKSVSEDLVREIKGAGAAVPTEPDDGPGLDADDQAALNDAVETVEAEGTAISERDPTVDAGATSADAAGATTGSDATDSQGTTAAALEADVGGQPTADLAGLDEGDLRERVQALKRRNRILEDEVAELRTILENVDRSGSDRATSEAQSRSAPERHAADRDTGDRGATGPTDPTRPVPPEPPIDRDGVAGTIVEFVAMLSYLWRSVTYRCRLFWYRLRRDDAAGAS
jgi:hypothetical protein